MTYTVTVATQTKKPFPMPSGPPFGIVAGLITLSSTDNTATATLALTGLFATTGPLNVVCDGVSSLGYVPRWDATNHIFRAYLQTGTAAALTEAATNTNAGSFNFIAFGKMG